MSALLFSRADDGAVGSFYYPLGLVEFTVSDDALAIIRNPRSVRDDTRDEETLTRLAYEVTGYLHEMRHFVDCFGTLAGLSLFSGRLQLMKTFASLCTGVVARDGSWSQPPFTWARDPNGPQEVRNFVRAARAFSGGEEMFVAPVKPLEVDGHLEDLHLEIDYERGGKIDASPLRMMRVRADGQPRPRSVLYPLGLETLLEGNAHAVGRNFVEAVFPPAVVTEFERRAQMFAATDASGGRDHRAAQTATPYMVVDLLITRHLRQHGIAQFPRNLVFAAIDRVLSQSSIRAVEDVPGTTAMHVDRVGANLLELLKSTDSAVLASGALPADPFLDTAYAELLTTYEALGGWETVHDDLLPAASIAIWESYVTRTFIVPLLRQRVASGGRAFSTGEGFLDLLASIGLPPARSVNGRLMLSMPQRVQQAWWHCLMLGEVMWQVARSSGPVFCPRAQRAIPGIDSVNLAFDGDCKTHLVVGCGTHRHGVASYAPNCLFDGSLRVCGLK